MLELLQPLGRHLAAEGAGGDRPFPDGIAAVVEFHAAGALVAGFARPARTGLPGAVGAGLDGGFGVVCCSHYLFSRGSGLSQPELLKTRRKRHSCS